MAEKLLGERKVANAKSKATPYRLNDGGGLTLRVMPNGSKYWQVRYRYAGKENTLQIGSYPHVLLVQARRERDKHREVLRQGQDPIVARKFQRSRIRRATAETFGAIAQEWLEHRKPDIAAVTHERNEGLVRRVLTPMLGDLPLREVDATLLLSALRAAEKKGLRMSARRARIIAGQIFGYALASGRGNANPARDVAKALTKKPVTTHHTALSAGQIGPLLVALDRGPGVTDVVAAALKLMLYTGLRDGSLRGAQWKEIAFEGRTWTIPASRTKRREEHIVSLPKQAITVLTQLHALTGRGPHSFVFASTGKDGFLAENTLRVALHRLGFKVTAHGFRSLLTDELYKAGFRSEWVERQMHHKDANEVRAAYLRTDFLEQRTTMMQWWADACDAARAGKQAPKLPSNVIDLKRAP